MASIKLNDKSVTVPVWVAAIFGLGLLVATPFLALMGAFVWGWVFWCFYDWFVVPAFTNLPAISYLSSVGLMFFVGLLKMGLARDFTVSSIEKHLKAKDAGDDEDGIFTYVFGRAAFAPITVLLGMLLKWLLLVLA